MKNKRPFKLKLTKATYKYLGVSLISLITFISSLWIQNDSSGLSSRPHTEHTTELYSNQTGDNLTNLFVNAINSTKQSLTLVVYSLTDPAIINALHNKCSQGVDVRVICDAKASPYIDSKLGPKVRVTRRFGPGLMHQKLLVVDDKQVWIGSANMTTESLSMHGNLVMALTDSTLASLISSKAATLKIEGRDDAFPMQKFDVKGQDFELWFLPDNRHAVKRLESLIAAAKKTVRIAMFTWTRYDLANAVIQAAQRGVNTEVVIDHYSGKGASAKVVALLKKNNIPVSLSRGGPLLHHKFLYIDGHTLAHGSANWTKAAFTQNDDCFIVMHNLTQKQHSQMEALWSKIISESQAVK